MTHAIRTTVIGNLTADPEVRTTPTGISVATFSIASTPQRWDKDAGKFVDADTTFLRCQAWRGLAENIGASLRKGHRVIATGTLTEDRWEAPDGTPRSGFRLTVDGAGPDLMWATATPVRGSRHRDDGAGVSTRTGTADPWETASPVRPTSPARP